MCQDSDPVCLISVMINASGASLSGLRFVCTPLRRAARLLAAPKNRLRGERRRHRIRALKIAITTVRAMPRGRVGRDFRYGILTSRNRPVASAAAEALRAYSIYGGRSYPRSIWAARLFIRE